MTEKHHLLTNDEFEKKFSSCGLHSTIFTHEAHLRITYIYLTKYGLKIATDKLSEQIAELDNKYGDGTKFNKKLTVAATKIMNYFVEKTTATDFNGFIKEFPLLKTNFSEVIKKHALFEATENELLSKENILALG